MDPWGTPQITRALSEKLRFLRVHYKHSSHFVTSLEKRINFIFSISIL